MSYIYNLTDTWNAAGTTFASIKMAVTNTASSASSNLLDLSVSGATTASFTVSKFGALSLNGSITSGTQQTAQGSLILANTAAGAFATTVQSSNSASAAWTLTLPATAGTANYALTTNGSGVSSWSQISLTAGVTGALPIANGGTNNSSAYTAGSVIFSNGTALTQNNSKLFWDNSSNRLGVNTASPSYSVDVTGSFRATNDIIADNGVSSSYAFPLNAFSSSSFAPQLLITNSAADSTAGYFYFAKGRTGNTTSQNGDDIGTLLFQGRDTSNALTTVGAIIARQTAAAGAGSVPGALLFFTGGSERLRADSAGNVIVNTAAIATTATDGFLYVPTCAGTPTGTPTTYTGRAPIVVDTTNNKLYFYSGGVWRDAGP